LEAKKLSTYQKQGAVKKYCSLLLENDNNNLQQLMYILFVARGPGCIYFNSKHQFYISIEIEETQWAQSTRSTALKMDIRYVMHRRVFWRDERKLALLTCACTFALRQQEGGYVQELCGFGGNIV